MIWPLWGRVCRVARGVKAGAAVHLRMARKLIGTVQPVLSITFVGTIDEALYCRVESRDLVRRACGYSKYAAWSNTPEPRVEKHFKGGPHNSVHAISGVSHSRKRNRILEQAKKMAWSDQ
jgi:hypothetical protein